MLALDPLLTGHIGLAAVLIVILKVVVLFVFLLIATMFMVWFERKIIGDMQNRIGPDRAGPFGILQTLADGTKLLLKEDLIPSRSDRIVFRLAPFLSLLPAFLTFAVIPMAGDFTHGRGGVLSMFGHKTLFQVVDPQIGFLLALAMSSIAVYGIMLAGWSSGSKYPLLGSVRATAQMVSYEAALGLSVATVFLVSGGINTNAIVASQATWKWSLWVTGIVPFVIFLIAGTAEANRPPFDLVEAEQELVGGFNTEYSSFRFALFYLAEFMNAITLAAITVTLFLGGPNGPMFGPQWLRGWILPLVWFFAKLLFLLYCFVWVRATLPRFRYDQLMDLGWKVLIPLGLGWLLLLALVRVGNDLGWHSYVTLPVGVAVLVVCYGVLVAAIRVARHNRELTEAFD
jgi:NADH-quinone oxidoreductase subunit H